MNPGNPVCKGDFSMPEVIVSGPAGRIEARWMPQPSSAAPVMILMHPHPLKGGTMNNRVVHLMYRCAFDHGFSVMRFNFRGVGKSEGVFDKGEGELSDAAAVLDWIRKNYPDAASIRLGGFSFGAWIAMQLLMRRPEMAGFVVVSPPAGSLDFNFLAPCPSSGMVIQGDQDTVVDVNAVTRLVQKLQAQKNITVDYRIIPGAGHFFTEQQDELYAHVADALQQGKPSGAHQGGEQDGAPLVSGF